MDGDCNSDVKEGGGGANSSIMIETRLRYIKEAMKLETDLATIGSF